MSGNFGHVCAASSFFECWLWAIVVLVEHLCGVLYRTIFSILSCDLTLQHWNLKRFSTPDAVR